LSPLNWPENQRNTKPEIEKVPSWHQKGTQLLTKKVWYLISILTMASEPVKMSEMLNALDYKNQKTFRDNYLSPLRQVGFIKFTNPAKPTDPDNKYRITEAGKMFLGGTL
jgi:ATP-dependent DNA helicase RecG